MGAVARGRGRARTGGGHPVWASRVGKPSPDSPGRRDRPWPGPGQSRRQAPGQAAPPGARAPGAKAKRRPTPRWAAACRRERPPSYRNRAKLGRAATAAFCAAQESEAKLAARSSSVTTSGSRPLSRGAVDRRGLRAVPADCQRASTPESGAEARRLGSGLPPSGPSKSATIERTRRVTSARTSWRRSRRALGALTSGQVGQGSSPRTTRNQWS